MNNKSVLEFKNVSRSFDRGRFLAVDDVSFDVSGGEVHSLIGPNGAGKTTLVKMAATILNPSEGQILVNGYDSVRNPGRARQYLGLVIGGELGFYPRASAEQNLRFFADIAGVPGNSISREVARVLEAVALADRAKDKVGTYSRGMVQRLHIARALLGDPKLLIMDEPTSGLDPDIAITIRALIKQIVSEGRSVVLTSHTMSEIEDLSSRISIIGAGKIHASGSLADILRIADISAITTATIRAQDSRVVETLNASPGIKEVQKSPKGANWEIAVFWNSPVVPEEAQAKVREVLLHDNVTVPVDLVSRRPTLEEAYVSLAGELAR